MKPERFWDDELMFLAREWQPSIINTILKHYKEGKEVESAREAFSRTYERFFLSPSKEDIYG